MSNLVIRNYKPEDLPDVVNLYNISMAKAPSIFRDGNYFDYFTSHPSVKEDSIFIAASECGVEGVAVIAIIHKRYAIGRIIELWASETAAADALVQKAVEYCQNNNIDAVEVRCPTFLDLDKTFAGWQRINLREVMMAKSLSLVPLLQGLFDATTLRKIRAGKGFLFVCEDEIIEVKINETEANVVERDKYWQGSDYIVVRASSKTLLEVVFGLTSPYIALLTGRVKIRGIKNISRAMKMLKAIRISQPWTAEIGDSR
ncbi:hypothetical protein ES703_43202 [subsurface metagenome]